MTTLSSAPARAKGEKNKKPAELPVKIRQTKMLINGVGTFFTATILMITLTLKFHDGGWVTVVITGGLILLCYTVRRHYERVSKAIEQLEADVLPEIFAAVEKAPAERDPDAPTAVLLVSGFNGLGLATLLTLRRLFRDQYRNVIFVGVGEVESSRMKGPEEVKQLEQQVADDRGRGRRH